MPEVRRDEGHYMKGAPFFGAYILKRQGRCANCRDPIPAGTPVLHTNGHRDERSLCPRCFNALRGALIYQDSEMNPRPVLELWDVPDDAPEGAIPENGLTTCPKCGNDEFAVEYLSYWQDNLRQDLEMGEPEWLGADMPSQDPGDLIWLSCRECGHLLYERRYA